MDLIKQELAYLIKGKVRELNRLIEKAEDNNLTVKIYSNEFSFGKAEVGVNIYEKVMY